MRKFSQAKFFGKKREKLKQKLKKKFYQLVLGSSISDNGQIKTIL